MVIRPKRILGDSPYRLSATLRLPAHVLRRGEVAGGEYNHRSRASKDVRRISPGLRIPRQIPHLSVIPCADPFLESADTMLRQPCACHAYGIESQTVRSRAEFGLQLGIICIDGCGAQLAESKYPQEVMRAHFTFISLLLLILVTVGYYLSYMEGFLAFSPGAIRDSIQFWKKPSNTLQQDRGASGERDGRNELRESAVYTGASLRSILEDVARQAHLHLESEAPDELREIMTSVSRGKTDLADFLAPLLRSSGLGFFIADNTLRVFPMRVRTFIEPSAKGDTRVAEAWLTSTLPISKTVNIAVADEPVSSVLRLRADPLPARGGLGPDETGSMDILLRLELLDHTHLAAAGVLYLHGGAPARLDYVSTQPISIRAAAGYLPPNDAHLVLGLRRRFPGAGSYDAATDAPPPTAANGQ